MNALVLLWLMLSSFADGTDPIRRFTPADYKAAFQNWGVVQDADGRLFSANTAGVLMYDGARWALYPVPGDRLVRSIGIDSTGRVWVGAESLIGHLEPDLELGYRFVTDIDSVKGEVWSIRSNATSTWFQASDELVVWQEGGFKRIPFRTGAQKALWNIDGRMLVHEFGVGWAFMEQGERVPVPELKPFDAVRIISFLPESDGSWIIVTRSNGLFKMEADLRTLRPLDIRIPETTAARRLDDGSIVIGTVRNGVILLTKDLKERMQPGQEIGLHLDAIWAVMQDREGHVWLGTDRGLVQMYRYPDFDSWDSRFGLVGNIQAIHRFNNKLVIGTSVGLFIQTDDGFQAIEDVDNAVWDLQVIAGELWIATAEGIRLWNGTALRPFGPNQPTFSIRPDVSGDGRIWIGVAGGLMLWSPGDGMRTVPGVSSDVRNMAQTSDGTLWAGTTRGGVVRVTRNGSVSIHLASVAETRVALHRDGLLAGTADGIRRWDESTAMFVPWEASSEAGVYRMVADSQESLWVVRYRNSESWLEQITTQGSFRDPFRRLPNRGLLRIFPEPEWVWIGTTSGLYRIRRESDFKTPAGSAVVLHSLRVGATTRIRFAAPWFEDPESVMYRYRLAGDTEWTEWGRDTEALFLGLWEGTYRFEAESVNKYGTVTRLDPVEFRIPPPWYRTTWAYFGVLVLLGLALFGTVRGTQRYTRLRTMRLEKLVRDRTRQVNRQKQELIRSNQSLTFLIDQKNTMLGIAAHDLKNPLATIQGFAELLGYAMDEEEDLNRVRAELKEQIGYITSSSNDMQQIIRDLLELAIAQKSEIVMHPKAFPLTDMVYTITASYQTVAAKKDIRLDAHLPPESMVAFADSDRMQEVILNLVSNAVKYTRVGGAVEVTVERREESGQEWVGVMIRDEGPGFTEQDKVAMFGLFTKLSAKPTANERSNGIGLYIVKEFTERNGGRLELSTHVGVGSTFSVWLPTPTP